MKNIFLFLFALAMGIQSRAQVVTTAPLFPVDGTGSVTLYFHADQGNQGLKNFTGSVYIHTGVVTAGPTSTAWTYVATTWPAVTPAMKCTFIGNNTWSFTIPNLRAYYGVPTGTTIYKIACLFRDSVGNNVGRDVGGADIFIPVIQPGVFTAHFFTPVNNPVILPAGSTLSALFGASQTATTISVYRNGTLINTYNNRDSVTLSLTGVPGINRIRAVATNASGTAQDSFYFVQAPAVVTAALPAGTHDGINYINDSTATLVLVAPRKQSVFVLGDFNSWTADTAYFMHRTADSTRWWITLTHLVARQQYAYQYLVDGSLKIADPYTEMVLDPGNDPYIPASVYPNLKAYPTGLTTGIVSVLQTAKPAYNWTATGYQKPDKKNLVIYELHVRDFVHAHSYSSLKDTLFYLKNLGVNAIELMPISEFEGNDSWGYNPNFYFAPDKYYGPADSLKSFIDLCHQNNIAVIQDMVFNHSFGSSPMVQLYADPVTGWPAANNPWYNPDCDSSTPGYQGKHPDGVGYDFNHESAYTKKFFSDAVHHWVNNYKIDGYRFDLAKGFTQVFTTTESAWGNYDQSRVNIWTAYGDSIWANNPGTYIILEDFAANNEEAVLVNQGMMVWGPNMVYPYEQSAMGYATSGADLTSMSYQALGWSQPGLVGYMESHDEERVMYKCEQYGAASGSYNIKNVDTALNRIKLNATFFFPIPGPKMIWEFEELGYDTSINFNGRIGDKPILWNYLQYPGRLALYKTFRALTHLKTNYPAAFNTTNYTLNVGNYPLRTIYLNDASMQVAIAGNFDVNPGTITINFQHTGWWYDYFSGDSINVTSTAYSKALRAGEYHLYTSAKLPTPDMSNPVAGLGVNTVTATGKAHPYLYQNFPNPFSNASTVDFSLPESTNAVLQITDVAGRNAGIVANRRFDAGNYTFNLSGEKLQAGVYFLTLTTGDGYRQSVSFTVVK